ncbi:MAG TPA: hypothetical protein VL346_07450 [Acidobacteriaceae bacterium]|nr:hypothetical protein [Acidobacteriaceae bacterium]
MMLSVFEGGPLQTIAAGGLFLFLSVTIIAVFTFISIAVWTEARRKEREAYYKAETLRRLTEMPGGEGARAVIELMREEERIEKDRAAVAELRKLDGIKIGAVVNIGIGIALWAFLRSVDGPGMVGAFPLAIGVALAIYAYFLADKTTACRKTGTRV